MSAFQTPGWRAQRVSIVVLHAYIGASYLWGADPRTSSPAFRTARQVLPIPAWGLVFIAAALLLAVTPLRRHTLSPVLLTGAVLDCMWSFFQAVSAAHDSRGSLAGIGLWAFAAMSGVALQQSVRWR